MKEADITISGRRLSEGQSMALRVAVENFTFELMDRGLGNDEHGKRLTQNYLDRLDEIRELIFETAE
jgi:hypothetical protein